MRWAIGVGLALLVAGCASLQGELSPQQRVYALQREFDVTLAEVEAYAALPVCTDESVTACSEPEVVSALVDASEQADSALDDAEAVVRTPGSEDSAVVYINAARAALNRVALILVEDAR